MKAIQDSSLATISTDRISGEPVNTDEFILKPYQYVWLTTENS